MTKIIRGDAESVIREPLNWEALRGKRLLVTGAGGMIGSAFVRAALALNGVRNMGVKVFCLVRNPDKLAPDIRENPEVGVLKRDVRLPIDLDGGADYIFHAASPASPLIMRRNPADTINANYLGMYNCLELARRCGGTVMFASSREVYGQPRPGQEYFREDEYGFVDPLNPRSCYPEGKKAAETLCVSYREQYGTRIKIARLGHVYGPGMSLDDGRVQADFLRNYMRGEDIVLKSDGSFVRTYTYLSDAVAGLYYILLKGGEPVYNIADENCKISIRGLAETLADISAGRISLKFDIPEATDQGAAPFTDGILNSGKLRGLGWKPKFGIREGLIRTIENEILASGKIFEANNKTRV